VSLTLPSPAVAVKADGGSAVDPLLGHPPSNGVTIATINIQNKFFIVEFLEGDLLCCGIRNADSQPWNSFPQTHCHIQIVAKNLASKPA